MNNDFKFWLGTLVAYILIGIYATAVFIMIVSPDIVNPNAVNETAGLTSVAAETLSSSRQQSGSERIVINADVTGIVDISVLIGGLISALIVSVLATTKPQQGAITRITNAENTFEIKNIVIYLYIVIWLLAGVSALISGTMLHLIDGPFEKTISNIGAAWLATAIGCGYAYFGLNPSGSTSANPVA